MGDRINAIIDAIPPTDRPRPNPGLLAAYSARPDWCPKCHAAIEEVNYDDPAMSAADWRRVMVQDVYCCECGNSYLLWFALVSMEVV